MGGISLSVANEVDGVEERSEIRAAEAWFRKLAAAEYAMADWCRGRDCAADVTEYHRVRGSAFTDAAISIARRLFAKKDPAQNDFADFEFEVDSPPKDLNKPARPRKPFKKYEHAGESLTVPEWAARLGITPAAIYSRINARWTIEEVLTSKRRRPPTNADPRRARLTASGAGVPSGDDDVVDGAPRQGLDAG